MDSSIIIDLRKNKIIYLILAHLLILLGYVYSKGLFSDTTQLYLILLGWFFLLMPFVKKPFINFNFSLKLTDLMLYANLVSFVLFYFFDGGIYLISRQAYANIMLLKFLALISFFLYFVNFNLRGNNFFSAIILHFSKFKFTYLVIIAIGMRLAIIFYSPAPAIDVFWVLDGGAQSSLKSESPYAGTYFKVYPEPDYANNIYSYLPVTIAITDIFKVFFGDVRFTHVFAQMGMAVIIYFFLKKKNRDPILPQLASLLIMYAPLSLFNVEQAWVDSLSLFLIYLFSFLVLNSKSIYPYMFFGLMLGIKQISYVFLFFLMFFKSFDIKKFLSVIIIPAAAILPFLIFDYDNFIRDTVTYHVKAPVALFSLTFNTVYKLNFYTDFPLIILAIIVIILMTFLVFKILRGKREIPEIINAATVLLLAIFLVKQGFVNYYFHITGVIILLISLELYNIVDAKDNY